MMCMVGKSADLERYTASGCAWLVRVQILKGTDGIVMCLVGKSADLERYTASGCAWLVRVHIWKRIRYLDVVGW